MKAQLFSIDFLIALFIFIAALLLVSYVSFANPLYKDQINDKANNLASLFALKNFGEENILDCGKILEFKNKGYNEIRKLSAPYDISVDFNNKTAICKGSDIDFGYVLLNTTKAASVVRIISIDKNKMQMVVTLYD